MVLSGDRKPLENGVLQTLLRGQEVLISGRVPDWALNSAALDFLHKAAYLTGDGRWLTYRERTGLDTDVFRLGQSFWPDDRSQAATAAAISSGKWTDRIPMPKPMWQSRGNGFPLGQSFLNASYRSAADASGDYILLDGMNGASRNPYHTFDILEYRLDGQTLLQGYHNQVLTSADGMVEPKVPDGWRGAISTPYWARWHVCGRSARAPVLFLAADAAAPHRPLWPGRGRNPLPRRDAEHEGHDAVATGGGPMGPRTAGLGLRHPSQFSNCAFRKFRRSPCGPNAAMNWRGPGMQRLSGATRSTFWDNVPTQASPWPACRSPRMPRRLALPEPAVTTIGDYQHTEAQFAVLATDHLYGWTTSAGLAESLIKRMPAAGRGVGLCRRHP